MFKGIPLVFEVRDLWPESAVALGELSNPSAISLSTRLEQACYRRAIQVVVVTQGIFNRLVLRGIPSEKLYLLPNGANTDLFTYNLKGRERIRSELGLEHKFIAIYAGIHGLAQGLETILDAAQILQTHSDIHIILIGDGPKKADILSLAASYNLPNLTLLPEKPREQMPDYLSASDIALIPLKKADIFKVALPSKIFDAWACERPVLLSIDGEARQVVESVNGGAFILPEDPTEMAKALIDLKESPAMRETMGKNGLIYTRLNHSRAALAEKLIQHLEKYIQK
jgi:glycosyltransferase involved in cell wall biosynthesis